MAEKTTLPISTTGVGALFLMLLLVAYVGSFCYLSQCYDPPGYERATDGYYFAYPLSDEGDARHRILCNLYRPLIEIDASLVTGRQRGASHLKFVRALKAVTVVERISR